MRRLRGLWHKAAMKTARHDENRLKLKSAQRARLLKLAKDRKASRKDREWAKRQLAENGVATVFGRIRALRKRLSLGKGESAKDLVNEGRHVEKGDPMVALANRGFVGPESLGLGRFDELPEGIDAKQLKRWLASKKCRRTAEYYALTDLARFKLHLGFKALAARRKG